MYKLSLMRSCYLKDQIVSSREQEFEGGQRREKKAASDAHPTCGAINPGNAPGMLAVHHHGFGRAHAYQRDHDHPDQLWAHPSFRPVGSSGRVRAGSTPGAAAFARKASRTAFTAV